MNPAIWRRDNEKLEREMSELLAQRTHEDDTHPSLRDRLEAIGEAARFPPVPARSAADELLGPEASAIASALDAGWRERYAARWKKHYESRQAHQRRVAELQAVASPTAEQLFELGQAVEALDGAEQALPHYDAALVAGHAGASLAVGRIRLEREDESGVPLIEHAMEMNPELVAEGCELLARFHEDRGRMVDAHRYTAMAARRGTRDQLATTERNEVTVVDRFVAHGLHDGGLAPIIALLEREASIAQAMLVRKELRYSTGFQFVLAIVPKGPAVPGVADRLQNELTLPAPVRIVLLSRVDGSLRSALESTPGAAIF
jgi:hypothetical protein